MTSQNSTSKNTICLLSLIREDLRHKNWMLALSILGSFLAGPVAAVFFVGRMLDYGRGLEIRGSSVYNFRGTFVMTLVEYYQLKLSDALNYLSHYYLLMMLGIAFVGAMIVALGGFRYLYHKTMVDTYHSAPVSRKKLFLAVWLSGFLIWFVPMVVGSLLVFPILVYYAKGTFFATILVHLLLCMLRLTLCFLIVYNACLVAVMLSGNVLNAIVGSLSYGTIVVMIVFAFQILEETFYENVFIPRFLMYMHPAYAFSPLVTPWILVTHWIGADEILPYYGWHLCVGTLLMIFHFFLAYLLYQKRPSELAERGIENKAVRIALRALISFIGGIGFTMIFYAVANHQFGWMFFGAFFGSAIAFCVMNVICHGSFKEVFSHKLQYVCVLTACILLFACMFFDLTGYGKRLPKAEDVKCISIYADAFQDYDWGYVVKDGKLQKQDLGYDAPGLVTYGDKDHIHAFLSACINRDKEAAVGLIGINVKVTTKWGSYYRRYHLPFTEIELLKPMLESKEYQDYYYPLRSLRLGYPKTITLTSSFSKDERIEDEGKIEQLMNAFHQDFEEHNGLHDLLRDSRTFTLNFYYYTGNRYVNFSHNVPYWYEHTIELIKSWYPKKVWDPSVEDVTSLNLNGFVALRDGETLQGNIYRLYGYDAQGNPLSEPPLNLDAYSYDWTRSAYWGFELDDLAFLKELEPYLIWGNYTDDLTNEYAPLGWAEFEDMSSIDCYVRYGTLPLSVIERIRENAVLQDDLSDVYYDEYYEDYNDVYYYEDLYYDGYQY